MKLSFLIEEWMNKEERRFEVYFVYCFSIA